MIEGILRNTTPRMLKKVIQRIGSQFTIYRQTYNEFNEPSGYIQLCEGRCLYHEAIYRQLANEYKDTGVVLRNLPGKFVKIIPQDVKITEEGEGLGITKEDFCGTILRNDLLVYDNKVYTIISTGDSEVIRSAFANFMVEEVKSDARQ